MSHVNVKLRIKQHTSAEWLQSETPLLKGEPGYETDTSRLKFGDGVSLWGALSYVTDEVNIAEYLRIENFRSTLEEELTPLENLSGQSLGNLVR